MTKAAHPKQAIFIDTNIYLQFYNSNAPGFKKLLASLEEISSLIIVTDQIVDEIDRNKLTIFSNSMQNYVIEKGISKSGLPEHFDGNSRRIKAWNEKRAKLLKEAEGLNKELQKILEKLLTEVSESKDNVSLALADILKHPTPATPEQIAGATLRKTLGNPPGKHNDPIGDELNWIVLLESVKEIDHLWIVTNDRDYCKEYNRQFLLNPYLHRELHARNPAIKVSIFDKLTDALRDFNEYHSIESLPEEKELKQIAFEEPDRLVRPILIRLKETFKKVGLKNEPPPCPYCDFSETLPMSSGVYTLFDTHFYCPACEMVFDVDETNE